jgi:hypothetical protein
MNDPQYLDESFARVCDEMLKTFIKKNKDYGKGNILDTGELGVAFRINDKLNRIKNLLMTKQQPKNETVEDSWLDIAVYAVIAVMYLRGWFQKLQLKEPPK